MEEESNAGNTNNNDDAAAAVPSAKPIDLEEQMENIDAMCSNYLDKVSRSSVNNTSPKRKCHILQPLVMQYVKTTTDTDDDIIASSQAQAICDEYVQGHKNWLSEAHNVNETLHPILERFVLQRKRIGTVSSLLRSSSSISSESAIPAHSPTSSVVRDYDLVQLLARLPKSKAIGLVETAARTGPVVTQGRLRKKGRWGSWHERFFKIRSVNPEGGDDDNTAASLSLLCYCRKEGDAEPRDWYVLGPKCSVDETVSFRKSEKLYAFKLRICSIGREEVEDCTKLDVVEDDTRRRERLASEGEGSNAVDTVESYKKQQRRKRAKLFAATAATTAVVLTGGVAGVGMAAAAAAGAAGAGALLLKPKEHVVSLASESRDCAEVWRSHIEKCIKDAQEQWDAFIGKPAEILKVPASHLSNNNNSMLPMTRLASVGKMPIGVATSLTKTVSSISSTSGRDSEVLSKSMIATALSVSWKLYSFQDGLRIYEEVGDTSTTTTDVPSLKTSVVINNTTPDAVFSLIMNLSGPFYDNAFQGVITDARVVTALDEHSDIIYLRVETRNSVMAVISPRDFCLLRYWRKEENGSFVICFQSTTHPECPVRENAIRARWLGGGFILAPPANTVGNEDSSASSSSNSNTRGSRASSSSLVMRPGSSKVLVTYVVQADPLGWVSIGYKFWLVHGFIASLMGQICVIKDVIEHKKRNDTTIILRHSRVVMSREAALSSRMAKYSIPDQEVLRTLRGNVPITMWEEPPPPPSSSEFFIKQPKTPFFSLIGMDKFKLPSSRSAASHIMKKHQSEKLSSQCSLLVLNLMIPGPPAYNLIMYFSSNFEKCPKVFEEFKKASDRDSKLTIHPVIVSGSWIAQAVVNNTKSANVAKHVGKTSYYQDEDGSSYFEIDVDLGRNKSLASGVLWMLLGQAPLLVIDIAIVLQINDDEESLVLGSARIDKLDFIENIIAAV